MRAYSETYLSDAMNLLGEAFDYAVYDCHYELAEFFDLFLISKIASGFERGVPKYVAGMSGPELVSEVNYQTKGEYLNIPPSNNLSRSPEYWAGWIMAYYQWYSGLDFFTLVKLGVTIEHLLNLYPTLHEADTSKFVILTDQLIARQLQAQPSRLQQMRRTAGLTQAALAKAAGVTLRMVQLYEQRQKDINKAQVLTLLRLSRALGCRMEDLLEPELPQS
jgi:DNA-binding transcriptional regulator YiaG